MKEWISLAFAFRLFQRVQSNGGNLAGSLIL